MHPTAITEKQINCTPVFFANKEAIYSRKYRVICNQGSTRSSKTYSICQLLPVLANESELSVTVTSPSLPHLKRGARRDFLEIMNDWGLYSDVDFNKTDQVYKFPSTGSFIEFFGADDSGKVRGPGRDILYVNEANLTSFETYKQLALRTRKLIIMDFNPADEFSYVYDIADAAGNKLIHSTYKNNLTNLSKEQIAEIESLKDADQNLWRVYGLGLRGTSSETIYTHWRLCDTFPQCEQVVYGVDFGFNNPSVLVRIGFLNGACYLDEMIYERKLTTDDFIYAIKTMGVHRASPIYCDAAEPKTIEEMKRAGLNALSADKAVREGINMVKSMPLFLTRTSTNMIKEIRSYRWAVDKDGKLITPDTPVKFMDHAMDAARYGVYSFKTKQLRSWII